MIDFLATEPHYLDHLAPLWKGLEAAERGHFYISRHMLQHAISRGIDPRRLAKVPVPPTGGVVVCAGEKDSRRFAQRPVVLLEHGAGQTYGDGHPSNAGGDGRGNVVLFLCPNADVAVRNLAAYPDAKAAVIGCPKLDPWHTSDLLHDGPVTVAVSFHWDNNQCPEARWAYPHYSGVLRQIAARWPGMIGHAHPKAWTKLRAAYQRAQIEPVQDFEDVLERADVYVCDNSSTLYEFASTGRPVVCLNAPWYRREIEHGLRFWSALPGVVVDEPAEIEGAIDLALEDGPGLQLMRGRAVRRAYTYVDGRAAEMAVRALRAVAFRPQGGRHG